MVSATFYGLWIDLDGVPLGVNSLKIEKKKFTGISFDKILVVWSQSYF